MREIKARPLTLADRHRVPSPKQVRCKKVNTFLLHLRQVPNVERAAAKAGIPRRTVYFLRERDARFKERMDRALAISIERLEEKAFQKAHTDNQILSWLLRCHKPDPYDPTQKHEVGLLGGIIVVPPKEDKAP